MDTPDLEQAASVPLPVSPRANGHVSQPLAIDPTLQPVLRDPVNESEARARGGGSEVESGKGEEESHLASEPIQNGAHGPSSSSLVRQREPSPSPHGDTVAHKQSGDPGHSADAPSAGSSQPPSPPAKSQDLPAPPPRKESIQPTYPVRKESLHPKPNVAARDSVDSVDSRRPNGRSSIPSRPPSVAAHRRSLTISKGRTVSVVLISSALETIASSKEAKRSTALKESVQRALEMVKSGEGGDRPREIFEPLRLACETRNEKLMIASLDCISKLISYSFFVESSTSQQNMQSPPPSPGPNARNSFSGPAPPMSLVDLVVNTITSCHAESTPDTVSLQIVKALLAIVLSPTILVHQSSLLKAVRTVYNVFLLSTDSVNQTVAQGGLTQMVNHVFSRCKLGLPPLSRTDSTATLASSKAGDAGHLSTRSSQASSSPQSLSLPPLTPPTVPRSVAETTEDSDAASLTVVNDASAASVSESSEQAEGEEVPAGSINGHASSSQEQIHSP